MSGRPVSATETGGSPPGGANGGHPRRRGRGRSPAPCSRPSTPEARSVAVRVAGAAIDPRHRVASPVGGWRNRLGLHLDLLVQRHPRAGVELVLREPIPVVRHGRSLACAGARSGARARTPRTRCPSAIDARTPQGPHSPTRAVGECHLRVRGEGERGLRECPSAVARARLRSSGGRLRGREETSRWSSARRFGPVLGVGRDPAGRVGPGRMIGGVREVPPSGEVRKSAAGAPTSTSTSSREPAPPVAPRSRSRLASPSVVSRTGKVTGPSGAAATDHQPWPIGRSRHHQAEGLTMSTTTPTAPPQ
ncbi:hypothetical protein SAMN05660642_04551 [Geodermatophilus siccatus]|uniref:Uncharacterized protein n=1 Tax=Geodermatophilus siccatus TaxID=1137991 RepID=A0A1H0ADF5_9ACTN|nr:hypothetical protein SAMN05660642_04551 [Geodermatophilus siccatus]